MKNLELPEGVVPVNPVSISPKVEISWFTQIAKVSEIFVSGIQFAFLSQNNQQCHQMLFCRDFLGDVMGAVYNNKPVSIYGFNYNPAKQPLADTENMRLIIANKSDPLFSGRIDGILDVLNQVEKRLDLKLTVAQEVTNTQNSPISYNSGVFTLVGSRRWTEAPPMVSLFTLLVRVGCSHRPGTPFMDTINGLINGEISEYQHYDKEYLESVKGTLEEILRIGYRPFFFIDPVKNYPITKFTIQDFHHSTGIVSLADKSSNGVVPHWSRAKLASKPSLDARRAEKLKVLQEK